MASIRNPWSKLNRQQRQQAWTGILFVLPWMISLLILTIYPILDTVYLSFTDYSILEAPKWVGLSNYQEIFLKDAFLCSIYCKYKNYLLKLQSS